jgi:hypothetical protein
MTEEAWFDFRKGKEIFCSQNVAHLSLYLNAIDVTFPEGKSTGA